jgi:hypothetical protein
VKLTWTGLDEMLRKILAVSVKFPDETMRAMYQEAQIEVTEMKRRCPVDTTAGAPHPGNLRASIHAEEPERQGKRLIQMFATGTQAPYAIYVHEDPDALHPVGQWKFMESVLNESGPYFPQRIAARVSLNRMAA